MKKNYIYLISLVIFSGCAAIQSQNCTENAGYEKGMNDAKMGRLMAMGQFAMICSGGDAEQAQKGYRAGYEAGKNSQGAPQVNLTLENGKLGLVGAYSCQIIYNNQSFTDRASSETQARNNVLRKCREKIPSCSENAITCSKN